MTQVFISVPTKLLLLVIGALLLLSAGFSVVSLSRLNAEFKSYQAETLVQGQEQFKFHEKTLKDQLRVWIESFSDVIHLQEKNDFIDLTNELSKQFDALQLHHNVEKMWLIDSKKNVLYSSSPTPNYVVDSVNKTLDMQEPQHLLYCQVYCEQLLTVPLLNKQGDMIVVALSVSLVDMIYAINQSIKSQIAIVSYPNTTNTKLHDAKFLSSSNIDLMQALFIQENTSISVEEVRKLGIQVDHNLESYLINLMPLASNNQRSYYMALIDDVTRITTESKQYRYQFLLSAVLIFVTLAGLVYFVASPLTQRLLVLSNALPLLARKEFDQFRRIKFKRKSIFSDELDVLADASSELSYELEQLNIEVEQKTKELENIAMYDLLTGLPNRNMLNYQLRKSVANLSQFKQKVAVLFLDLDDFKKVNDSHGHGQGDRLLIEAANRVRLSIRNVDVACRFGGDEFVVVLGKIESVEEAKTVAEEILQRFKTPIKIGSSVFYVSTSIGIAYTEDKMVKAEELISYADIAMYEAKDNGGAQYHIYHPEMYQRVAHRVMLEGEVRQALAKNQFSLSLQPQLVAKTNRIYGFEALLRWKHPTRGMISPDDFIPILENSTHMIELGYWIIRRCFELAVDIRNEGLNGARIAINLSAGQFIDQGLPKYLQDLLVEFSISASSFELELTEQTLVKNVEHTITMMETLKSLGFSFAIDDFGTGYSSLAYLKQMPVDVIKIDKSFIFGMLENHSDYQIIMSTIAMVKNLGLMVVAEGVETSAQLRSLMQNDCDLIQGYYFSKPIPEVELIDFIKTHIVDSHWKTKAQ
ncbi:putative bifunctional diguanylate cyclase/phosphodiesterase [Pseudocolwellia sp. HL-MZ19]|uniref:putative bifunctional diguanylate cyclase/phosphodiesterase n=1 Tax=unclassified Pseudocolwellia TaxID=2848178 RepID=UPI003CE8C659